MRATRRTAEEAGASASRLAPPLSTRRSLADAGLLSCAGRYPAERLTPLEALRGFTTSAAYAAFAENRLGVLAVGAHADFIVVDGDPLDAPEEGAPSRDEWETRLRSMRVRATVVGGRVMHGGF